MTKTLTTYLYGLLAGGLLLGACSRPPAYFQRGPVERYSIATPKTTTTPVADVVAPSTKQTPVTSLATTPPSTAVDQLEAYVRNDTRLAASKTLNKRINRIKTLVAASTLQQNQLAATTQHKTTLVEKLLTKKLNAKIQRHMAPNQPQKPMINGGLLGGSIVLVIVGLLLLFLTTGTVATIGLIAAVIGAIGVIFGLIAS